MQVMGGIVITYDGNSHVQVGKNLALARPPAFVSVSPDRTAWILNYGDGSGQVYSLEHRWLESGSVSGDARLRHILVNYAKSRGCIAKIDQISVIFDGWANGGRGFMLHTEDFSRKGGCALLAASFLVRLDSNGSWRITRVKQHDARK
jgi:hypothetical protein